MIYKFVSLVFHLALISVNFWVSHSQLNPGMVLSQFENTDPLGGFSKSPANVNADSMLIQKVSGAKTTYHPVDEPNGHPIFTRSIRDSGKYFVAFPHPSFPSGAGYYIILRRIQGQRDSPVNKYTNNTFALPLYYDAFTLDVKDTIHGYVTDLDPLLYNVVRNRVGIPKYRKRKWRVRNRSSKFKQ